MSVCYFWTQLIHLFTLYVLFSQFRPRDVLHGICLLFFHLSCIHMHVDEGAQDEIWKKPVLWGTITRSEIGKQNLHVQAKYVFFEKGCRKSALDNPERYCGWFGIHCSSKKFERMAREVMEICLRVLKKSNKSRFDSYSRHQEQCIDHIPY